MIRLMLAIVAISIVVVPSMSAQTLAAVEGFHGRLVRVASKLGVHARYSGGLTRTSRDSGLFSEKSGCWTIAKPNAGPSEALQLTLVGQGERADIETTIGSETLRFKFFHLDYVRGQIDAATIKDVLGVDATHFQKMISEEESPWPSWNKDLQEQDATIKNKE